MAKHKQSDDAIDQDTRRRFSQMSRDDLILHILELEHHLTERDAALYRARLKVIEQIHQAVCQRAEQGGGDGKS